MFKFLRGLTEFISALARDPRIPARDKALLAGLCAYLATPVDLIPDFIPLIGYLDDAVVMVIVLDFVFNAIPEEIVLEHFKWGPERYRRLRRRMRFFAWMIPQFVRRRLWKCVENSARSVPTGKPEKDGG